VAQDHDETAGRTPGSTEEENAAAQGRADQRRHRPDHHRRQGDGPRHDVTLPGTSMPPITLPATSFTLPASSFTLPASSFTLPPLR
jgi:hypothetical protein